MANTDQPAQGVTWDVGARLGEAWVTFRTEGVSDLTIPIDPQAAFDMGEKLARAAHFARFGQHPPDDKGYLHQQIKSRVTEELRMLLTQRVSVMLNSMRHDKAWTNAKLAQELVDIVLRDVG